MPVVPRFSLSQTEDTIILTVHLPYIRITNLEVDIQETMVSVYCQPYLLKLHFPGKLRNDEEDILPSPAPTIGSSSTPHDPTNPVPSPSAAEVSRAEYDPTKDNGTLTLTLRKAIPGQYFENLDMITRLLQPSSASSSLRNEDTDSFPTRPSPQVVAAHGKNTLSGSSTSSSAKKPLIEVIASEDFSTPTTTNDDTVPTTSETEENSTLASLSVPSVYSSNNSTGSSSLPSLLPSSTDRYPTYGFHRQFSQFFIDLKEEIQSSVISIPEPDTIPNSLRPLLRVAAENTAWDPERYIGDYMDGEEDPLYQEAINLVPFWLASLPSFVPSMDKKNTGTPTNEWTWAKEEIQELASLPNKEYLIDNVLVGGKFCPPVDSSTSSPSSSSSSSPLAALLSTVTPDTCPPETHRLLLGLITILFSYCYDYRLTGGEHNVESAWTITTLSPLLSWLDDEYVIQHTGTLAAALPSSFAADNEEHNSNEESLSMIFKQLNLQPPAKSTTDTACSTPSTPHNDPSSFSLSIVRPTVAHAIVACIRRCLLYPYLRRMDLVSLVIMDIATLFYHGPRMILRCLLKIRYLYTREESKYLLNTLFINDYCVWIQSIPPTILLQYGQDISFIGTRYRTDYSPPNEAVPTASEPASEPASESESDGGKAGPFPPRLTNFLGIIHDGLMEWKLRIIEERARNGEDIYSSADDEEDNDSDDEDSTSDDDDSDSSEGDEEGGPKNAAQICAPPLIQELN